MSSEHRWRMAEQEHHGVIGACIAVVLALEEERWARSPSPDRWSPAVVVLHLCQSYELAIDVVAHDGPGMRLRVAPWVAWLSRTFLLPVLLARKQFPRGARAPAELRPSIAEAEQMTPAAAGSRLERVADEAAAALRAAVHQQPIPRVTHAYFGRLAPLTTMRLLTAHTRHHTRALAAAIR